MPRLKWHIWFHYKYEIQSLRNATAVCMYSTVAFLNVVSNGLVPQARFGLSYVSIINRWLQLRETLSTIQQQVDVGEDYFALRGQRRVAVRNTAKEKKRKKRKKDALTLFLLMEHPCSASTIPLLLNLFVKISRLSNLFRFKSSNLSSAVSEVEWLLFVMLTLWNKIETSVWMPCASISIEDFISDLKFVLDRESVTQLCFYHDLFHIALGNISDSQSCDSYRGTFERVEY